MRFSIFNFQFSAKKGLTLIETLVAITILLIGVLGPMTAATRGITDGLYAQNQLIGTHLAQEGLDLLGVQIQNNHTNRVAFLTGLGNCLASPYCAVGALAVSGPITFPSCSSVSDCKIAYDFASNFYKPYDGSGNFVGPVFTRILTVESLTVTEVLLKSRVVWKNKATDATDKVVELYRYAFERN